MNLHYFELRKRNKESRVLIIKNNKRDEQGVPDQAPHLSSRQGLLRSFPGRHLDKAISSSSAQLSGGTNSALQMYVHGTVISKIHSLGLE